MYKRYKYSQHLRSESFSHFAYHQLKKITQKEIEKLEPKDQKIFLSDSTIRDFASSERWDYVAHMLSVVGISWTLCFEADDKISAILEEQTKDQGEYPEKINDIAEAAAKGNICVLSSSEAMFHSHLLAMDVKSKVYRLSLQTESMIASRKLFSHMTMSDMISDGENAFDKFVSLVSEQLNSFDYIEKVLGINRAELKIMTALFRKRNTAVSLKELGIALHMDNKLGYIKKDIENLIQRGLATKDKVGGRRENVWYMLSTKGIGVVMEYVKYIHKKTFGKI